MLPPWESAPYFQAPKQVNYITQNAGWEQVIEADPNRVLLVFGTTGGGGVILSFDPPTTGSGGINIGSVPFVVDHATFGPIVNRAWFIKAGGGGLSVDIMTLSLSKWPNHTP